MTEKRTDYQERINKLNSPTSRQEPEPEIKREKEKMSTGKDYMNQLPTFYRSKDIYRKELLFMRRAFISLPTFFCFLHFIQRQKQREKRNSCS